MPKKQSRANATPPVGAKNRLSGRFHALLAAVELTVSVEVVGELPAMLTEEGDKPHVGVAVKLLGLTEQVRLTVPVKLFDGVAVMTAVLPVVAPRVSVRFPLLVMAKSGLAADRPIPLSATA